MSAHVQSQIRALASAVARSYMLADLSHEQRHPERIEFTRLAWMAPPLMPAGTLQGEDLSVYFDYPLKMDSQSLHRFWVQTMHDLWHKPETTMRTGIYPGLSTLLRTTKVGSRALRFAQPAGWPNQIELQAGVALSLEVAHAAYLSMPCQRRVLTTNDYIVTAADGTEFGVRAGRPIIDTPWTYDASGEVFEMLEQPRGAVTYDCHYDQIAQVRSVLHTYPDAFRDDFHGLDTALQALRVLSWNSHCPNLVTALRVEPMNIPALKIKARALEDCLAAMESNRLNDRQKLHCLYGTLVPDVLSQSAFRKHIFSSPNFPFTMLRGHDARILEWLLNFYEQEIPCSLRNSRWSK